MSGSGAIVPQWALNHTIANAVSVSVGILEAATTNNVQALALLACEAFGGTLAMSVESKAKVNRICSQDQQSAVLKFLQAQIGYKRGDSGWQLSRTESGLRFLGLATCIVSCELWESAEMLRELIANTAEHRHLVPTSHQIKSLLAVLEHRLVKSSFMDNVLGWSLWLDSALGERYGLIEHPSTKVLSKLISCISNVARLGKASQQRHYICVKISHPQAAWTIAFLKWCLGHPPTVLKADEEVLLDQKGCQARVYALTNYDDGDVEVSVWNEFGSLQEMFNDFETETHSARGMVAVKFFAERMLQKFGLPDSLSYRNAREIIPYAWPAVYNQLSVRRSKSPRDELQAVWNKDGQEAAQAFMVTRGNIFPDIDVVAAAAAQALNDDNAKAIKDLPHGLTVSQLPLTTTMKQYLSSTCPCHSCLATSVKSQRVCDFKLWLRSVSNFVGLILLTSLFTPIDAEGVLYRFSSGSSVVSPDFCDKIYDCLIKSVPSDCEVSQVIGEALHLIGHRDVVPESLDWAVSSHYGQTVYPEVLQSTTIKNHGILSMICAPGALSRKGMVYTLITNKIGRDTTSSLDGTSQEQVDKKPLPDQDTDIFMGEDSSVRPHNDYRDSKLLWWVNDLEARLELTFVATNLPPTVPTGPTDSAPREVTRAIFAAAKSVFIDCSHDPSTPLTDQFVKLVTPRRPYSNGVESFTVSIVQTAGNEAMRYFTLAYGHPCIVREEACLACCVHVARILGYSTILC